MTDNFLQLHETKEFLEHPLRSSISQISWIHELDSSFSGSEVGIASDVWLEK
jgi:hypothetical protein